MGERVDVFCCVTKSSGVHYKDLIVVNQALDYHLRHDLSNLFDKWVTDKCGNLPLGRLNQNIFTH